MAPSSLYFRDFMPQARGLCNIAPVVSSTSSTGVSQTSGRRTKTGSCRMRLNPSSPMYPIPICSCRSSPLPRSPLVSLRWIILSRESPICSSNCARVEAMASVVRNS